MDIELFDILEAVFRRLEASLTVGEATDDVRRRLITAVLLRASTGERDPRKLIEAAAANLPAGPTSLTATVQSSNLLMVVSELEKAGSVMPAQNRRRRSLECDHAG